MGCVWKSGGKVEIHIQPAGLEKTRRVSKPGILECWIFDLMLFNLLAYDILLKPRPLQTFRSSSYQSPKRYVGDRLLKRLTGVYFAIPGRIYIQRREALHHNLQYSLFPVVAVYAKNSGCNTIVHRKSFSGVLTSENFPTKHLCRCAG